MKAIKIFTTILMCTSILILSSCSKEASIIGEWTVVSSMEKVTESNDEFDYHNIQESKDDFVGYTFNFMDNQRVIITDIEENIEFEMSYYKEDNILKIIEQEEAISFNIEELNDTKLYLSINNTYEDITFDEDRWIDIISTSEITIELKRK